MFFRSMIGLIALAMTMFIAAFGVCAPAMKGMGVQTGVHIRAYDCMGDPVACPMRLVDQYAFLNTFLPRMNQEMMGVFLVLSALIVLGMVWEMVDVRERLRLFAAFFLTRRKRYERLFLQWCTRIGLFLAFREGILHAKQYVV
ncbi:hypothetical protein KBB27_01910 [Patescibacteria group bacterium]|nr:hypothetical protein [Patescibacteria group bacterium]